MLCTTGLRNLRLSTACDKALVDCVSKRARTAGNDAPRIVAKSEGEDLLLSFYGGAHLSQIVRRK